MRCTITGIPREVCPLSLPESCARRCLLTACRLGSSRCRISASAAPARRRRSPTSQRRSLRCDAKKPRPQTVKSVNDVSLVDTMPLKNVKDVVHRPGKPARQGQFAPSGRCCRRACDTHPPSPNDRRLSHVILGHKQRDDERGFRRGYGSVRSGRRDGQLPASYRKCANHLRA